MPTATCAGEKRGDSVFKSILSIIGAAMIVMAGVAAAPVPAHAEDAPVRETHGAWEVRCKDGQCFMTQIASDDSGVPVLRFSVSKLATPRSEGEATFIAAAEISTKVGVFLPQGVTFAIDGAQNRKIPFERCFPTACVALPAVQQALIDSLKAGGTVTVTVFANPGEPVTANVSLSGFTAAYDSL